MPQAVPLILVPGLLCDAALWQHQIKHLKNLADCQIADTTTHDRLDAMVRHILTNAPSQFALAGLSMGGYVALEIMRQAPERVIKLGLMDTSARPDTPEQRERRQLLLAMSRTGQFKGVTPRLLPLLIHPDRMADKDLTDSIMAMTERVGHTAFQNQQSATLNRIDSRPFLKDIRVPTLVLGGCQDAITPVEVMREMAEGIPGAHLELLDDCGHLAPMEKPESVNRAMETWLGL
jgi:hypothetical protein